MTNRNIPYVTCNNNFSNNIGLHHNTNLRVVLDGEMVQWIKYQKMNLFKLSNSGKITLSGNLFTSKADVIANWRQCVHMHT